MGVKLVKPLPEYSTAELTDTIKVHLGPVYAKYAPNIEENCVDGSLISEMDEKEFQETLEDLGITSRLHGRVLTKEWRRAKAYHQAKKEGYYGVANQYKAVAEYQLCTQTPNWELTGFDQLAEEAYRSSEKGFLYAAVNFLSPTEQVGVATRLSIKGSVRSDRMILPAKDSQCVKLLLDQKAPDYVEQQISDRSLEIMKDVLPPNCARPHYYGHVVRAQSGDRIGMVCLVEEDDSSAGDKRQRLLKELARKTEEQLEMRKLLLQRNRLLNQQVNPDEERNGRVLASLGRSSKRFSQLSHERPSWFPYPQEIVESGKPRRSFLLPLIQENRATSKEELEHLPKDYFDFMDEIKMHDHTPVPRNDRERCAAVEAMGLRHMDPSSPTARALRNIMEMTSNVLDVPLAEVTFLTHDKDYSIARYMDASADVEHVVNNKIFTPIIQNKDNNKPFLSFMRREMTPCNYVAVAKRTFVVHNVHADESFNHLRDMPGQMGPKFYSGSPVLVHGEVLATLCCLDWRARPDFTKAHEIQQEQLASCVGREIELYMLRSQMEDLERQRRLFDLKREKIRPPDVEAALIFTDVQGSTKLWEANSAAMGKALRIHDDIMRQVCGEFHGYEVSTEGDAFHMAFHDSIDAVAFALKIQTELHNAPWSEEILALRDAAEIDGFRGLRVRIAIHFGRVHRRENELSGRSQYTGETVHVAKSLEDLAMGGQIIVSQDAWRGAAYLAESKLGSPQVIDIGKHVLLVGKTARDGVIAKQLYQVLPSKLAFDYFGNSPRQRGGEDARSLKRICIRESKRGRKFPPLSSQKQISSCFHDAPAQDSNIVTIAFVYTSALEKMYEDATFVLAQLTELISAILRKEKTLGGYQCHNKMLAFSDRSSAVRFGLALLESLSQDAIDNQDLSQTVKVGIYEGEYTNMGPQTTGRADYFGTCVNRAARVANASDNGLVCVGVGESEELPRLGEDIFSQFFARKQLKGVQEAFVLFSCSRKKPVD